MRMYVPARDDVLEEEVILEVVDGELERVIDPDEFEPDPFSAVANVLQGCVFKAGPYRYEAVGERAWTRRA